MAELVSQRVPFQVDPPVACEATSTLHMCCGDVDGVSTNVCGDCGRQANLDKLGLLSGSVSIVVSVCFVLGLWPLDPWPCSKMFATFLKVCSAVPATMRPTCQELTCPRVHSKTELLPKRSSIRTLLQLWSHQRMVRFLEYSQRRKICHIPRLEDYRVLVTINVVGGTQMWFSLESLRK